MKVSTALAMLVTVFLGPVVTANATEGSTKSYKHAELSACEHMLASIHQELQQVTARRPSEQKIIDKAANLYASASLRWRFAKYADCIRKAEQAHLTLEPLLQTHLSVPAISKDKNQ